MPIPPQENWTVTKPARVSEAGIVVAQHARAAAVGAEMLAQGGNAIDAAAATAFALAVLEPWMSGIGGVGALVYGEARTGRVTVVDFTPVAPLAVDPARYPLAGGISGDIFGWPLVEADRNLKGYEAICVPGTVDGLGLAIESFGRKSLAEAIAPAQRIAAEGLPIDWFTALQIALSAADLVQSPPARDIYLPRGLPPVPSDAVAPQRLPLPALARTLERLMQAGRRDFYEGALARSLLADLAAGGSPIAAADLAQYRARIVEPLALDYRGVRFHCAPALTGGPTFIAAMRAIDAQLPGAPRVEPDAAAYLAYAAALRGAFTERLAKLGHAMPPGSNTTNLCVVDRDGNMVALTNTVMSRFGAKVVLPATGIVMNNGMMWFDPVPGRPNSIAPGKRPLANFCPVVATRDGAPWLALGACGGRRIIPAVVQLASFLVDFDMPLEKAFATPRLDASTATIACDQRLGPDAVAALASRFPVEVAEPTLHPSLFAVPSAVMRDRATGRNTGMAHIAWPASAAIAEPAP